MRIKALNSEVSPGAAPIDLGGYPRWCVGAPACPHHSESALFLFGRTYFVVLPSVAAQGLTIEKLIKNFYP